MGLENLNLVKLICNMDGMNGIQAGKSLCVCFLWLVEIAENLKWWLHFYKQYLQITWKYKEEYDGREQRENDTYVATTTVS